LAVRKDSGQRDLERIGASYLSADLPDYRTGSASLADLWERGFNIVKRADPARRKDWPEYDLGVVHDAHRAAFIEYACERLSAKDAQTLRDRESDMGIDQIRKLRGVSVATIRRHRKRLAPRLESLWSRWEFSSWRRAPDRPYPFPYQRAKRHTRDQ
jgi:hypothetical protein